MDDYALVLNAGSSSLKFCVFQRPTGQSWRLEARGQIEGIGTSPRLSAKGADGQGLANQDVPVRDGREAVDETVFEHDDALRMIGHFGGAQIVGDFDSGRQRRIGERHRAEPSGGERFERH